MSKTTEDLLISKMDSSERGKALIEIMENNPGWSHNESTKRTMRKLGWSEGESITSDEGWSGCLGAFSLMSGCFIGVPFVGYQMDGFIGIFSGFFLGLVIFAVIIFVAWVMSL